LLRECEILRRRLMFPTDISDFDESVHETAASDDNRIESLSKANQVTGTEKWQA
jgi:hypothetical protein